MLYSSYFKYKSVLKTILLLLIELFLQSQFELAYSLGNKKINEVKIFYEGEEIHGENDVFLIDTAAFSIRFYNKCYNSEQNLFYAARLTAFYTKDLIPEIKSGMAINEISCFRPGTGIAPSEQNGYTALKFNANAHHYLFYQDENQKRLNKVGDKGEYTLFDFPIDTLDFWGEKETIHETQISQFYLLLLIDRNLNNIVDDGEYKIITVRIKRNYKGWDRCFWNLQDKDGLTPLDKLLAYHQWGDLNEASRFQILQKALSCRGTNINLTDQYGYTALHYAVTTHYKSQNSNSGYEVNRNSYAVIQTLLNQKSTDINKRDFTYKQSPFLTLLTEKESHYNSCTYTTFDSLVNLFLKRPDLDLRCKNKNIQSAFYFKEGLSTIANDTISADLHNDKASWEMIKIIEQLGYDETLEDDTAFFKKNINICFDYDADPNYYNDTYNYTPLIWLCSTNNRPYGYTQNEINANMQLRNFVLKLYLLNPKTDVNLPNAAGNTPLHISSMNFNCLLINTLMEDENIDFNSVNNKGNTPLMTLLESLKYSYFEGEELDCLQAYFTHKDNINFKVVNYSGNTIIDIIDKDLLSGVTKDYLKKSHMNVYTSFIELRDFAILAQESSQ